MDRTESTQPKGPQATAEKQPFLPAAALPKGGGAVRGIGEKLSVNQARGTCSLQVPIATSAGRLGFGPQLALAYDSGAGNSPFGMGWSLPLPAIARKTDKGIPRYTDADTFVFSGGEDLVPAAGSVPDEVIDGVNYHIERFRPRTESTFTRVERCRSEKGDVFWRTISADNVRSVYGRSARITDPADPGRVFQWLLEEVRDDRGNVAMYEYLAQEPTVSGAAWERNRRGEAQAQRYPHRITYCDHFVVQFEYEPRPDPFSTCRPGFEVRTWLRCRRIAMYHDFAAEFGDGPNPRLTRSTDLSYDDDPAGIHLMSVTQVGHLWQQGGYAMQSSPPLAFEYTRSQPDDEVRTVDAQNLPSGVDTRAYHWVDLDGEGVAGALTQQGGAWFYKRNLGGGRLGALEHVPLHPAIAADGGPIALVDLAADGRRALVRNGPVLHGYQERTADGWGPFQAFASNATVAWDDPALKHADLDGDGVADLLLLGGEELLHHLSLGREGYGRRLRTLLGSDEERGPVVVASDERESVLLADMSGDGLADLVRVRNGSVCYWPNLGHGRFGQKVTMAGAPLFDPVELFDPKRLRPADIDGSGTTDLLYLGRDRVRYWPNRSGNAFGPPVQLSAFPDTDDLATIDVVDLLGTGTSCLVWSSANPSDRESPLRYVDLCKADSAWLPPAEAAGHKPHMLCQITNNFGSQTRLVYAASTRFYLDDQALGRPWATRLHFPVQVVSRVETYDHVAKTRLVSGYRYRHGCYDAPEREFRGFGMVEQTDEESFPLFAEPGQTELHRPPVRTRSWFHLGTDATFAGDYQVIDPPLEGSVLPPGLSARERREALRALAGAPLRTEVYADDGDPDASIPYSVTEHRYRVEIVQHGQLHSVFRHHPLETLTTRYERDAADPRTFHEVVLEVDEYNTVLRSVAIGYPRRVAAIPEQETLAIVRTHNEVTHLTGGPAYRIALPVQTRTYEVTGIAPAGDRFTVVEAASPGTARLIDHVRTRYWDDDLLSALPAAAPGARALVHQTYRIAFTPAQIGAVFDGRVDDAMLAEGGYQFTDGAWWIPSGVQHYDADAFWMPIRLTSPFGNDSSVEYDAHKLLPVVVRQSLAAPYDKLITHVVNDYRVLSPREILDPNGNSTLASFDALGRVIATWARGKDGEGDPQALPGNEFTYGSSSWLDNGAPVWTLTATRERHGEAGGPWQRTRAYADGTGRVVLTKQQVEPGDDAQPRWVGSGRTVFDNKGKPVKQYEPYFSATDAYEDDPAIVAQGVTPIMHYDPVGRLIRTEHPDGTLSRAVIGGWSQEDWDATDTVLDSFWYVERGAPDPGGEPEPGEPRRRAAWLAAKHAATPSVSHLDSLGRTVRTVADAGPAGKLETVTVLDIEGAILSVTDPRGVAVLSQAVDLAGRILHTHCPDAGDRWILPDIMGTPVRVWDSRGYRHESLFDPLRRPTRTWVTPPSADPILVHAIWYGEDHPAALPRNLIGRAVITLDGSGFVHAVEHDFKGNLLTGRRRLAGQYQDAPDWAALDATQVADVETTAVALGLLEGGTHQTTTQFDALNRPTSAVLPDGTITARTYDEGGRLQTVKVENDFFVRELQYDAKGQRRLIVYGNFLRTKYTYDEFTFRLARVETFRSGAPNDRLQDLNYTYDPVGNVTEVRDDAQQTHFYAGQVTTPSKRYTYDAINRLVSAHGREHDSLGGQVDNAEPAFGRPIPHPNDAAKLRPYRQTYVYDESGNIKQVKHVAVGNDAAGWTRDYTYGPDSNRLQWHTHPNLSLATFGYDLDGNMTSMPHLPGPLDWDHGNRLFKVDMLGGGTGYYAYDAAGQRTRKVLRRDGGLIEERLYLSGYEIHRKAVNGVETFRRTTIHVMDDTRRIALIEHKTLDNGPADETRVRYQLGDHLGSCSLEVDDSPAALLVSYEEYHPYGTTALWLGANNVEVQDRRYRYTGKEKDEETGLYYHGARYYAPWLGRWTAPDPLGTKAGTNFWSYVSNRPVVMTDPQGTENKPANKTDENIMLMTDPQLYRLLKNKTPEERHNFCDGATGAFRNRAFAMIRLYKMEVQFTVKETVIVGEAPKAKEEEKKPEPIPYKPPKHDSGFHVTGGFGFIGLSESHKQGHVGGEYLWLLGGDKEKGGYFATLTGVSGKHFVGAEERIEYFSGEKGYERLVIAETEFPIGKKGFELGPGMFVNPDDPHEVGIFGFGSFGPVTGGGGVALELETDYAQEMKDTLAKQGIELKQLPPGVKPPRQPGWLEGTILSGARLLGLEKDLEDWSRKEVEKQNKYFEEQGSPLRIVIDSDQPKK
ncbi:MAG TPA: SpvB/TcaC N-terminal domain-containing protein [Candidatus Limnocylindrales bacterium]|nr:SpvB/TcaC N-terminal domain-containing protein [Candidatus Limnocylindrales bacterium]